jgi:hypothetical protein
MYLLQLNQYLAALLQHHNRLLLLCLQYYNQHLLLRLQLNEQTLAALPAANPDLTIAALPTAL